MWTSFHLGDQGRHGVSAPYLEWLKMFADCDCVKDPPRTQGIIEFHKKSPKHISLDLKRDRIDRNISNIFVAKNAKHRQFEIAQSRKTSSSSKVDKKVKDTLLKTIYREKLVKAWQKKQSSGPRFFQQNYLKKIAVKNQEDWEKVRVIPWGGQYRTSSGDSIEIINSCSVDQFLQMLYMFYTLNILEMWKLFENASHEVRKICEVVQLLMTEAFSDAKYFWLTNVCAFLPDVHRNTLDTFVLTNRFLFISYGACFREDINIFARLLNVQVNMSALTLPSILSVI